MTNQRAGKKNNEPPSKSGFWWEVAFITFGNLGGILVGQLIVMRDPSHYNGLHGGLIMGLIVRAIALVIGCISGITAYRLLCFAFRKPK